ncbi:hypothetical protein ACLK1T_04855 [Escherichia coli]
MRGLEREISKLCRKAVKQLLLDKSLKQIQINGDKPQRPPWCSAFRLWSR